MAFFDDRRMLLSHIRHSFITSDDTGMCELIMVNEDLDKEIQTDRSFQKKSIRMQQRYKPQPEKRLPIAMSFDIQTSPTLPRRPPLRNNANMFQVMEKRKKKNEKAKTVMWRETPSELLDRNQFLPQPVDPDQQRGPSPLTKLLAEQEKKTANMFFEYSKFNGENHGAASTNKYYIFLAMAKEPTIPVKVTVLHTATVEDLIGLTFWKYLEERETIPLKKVNNYSVMIAEDDGEIDVDLPELQRDDYIAKFGFKYLGIVESEPHDVQKDSPKRHLIVKVYYENGGFSTLAVDNLEVEMSELLTRVIRRRRLQIHDYELEKKDYPDELVDLSSTLASQGTMDFVLVRNIRRRSSFLGAEEELESSLGRKTQTTVRAELTSHQYKSYTVTMLQKIRANTKVHLGVDPERIEIQPVDQPTKSFLKTLTKPMRYDIDTICACEILEDRGNALSVFRLTRLSKDSAYKTIDFETTTLTAKEIVRKVNIILKDANSVAKKEYEEKKEHHRQRKSSKVTF